MMKNKEKTKKTSDNLDWEFKVDKLKLKFNRNKDEYKKHRNRY